MLRRAVVRRPGGLIGTAARTAVVAGTATAVSGRVARRQMGNAQAAQAAQQPAPPVAEAPAEAPAPPAPAPQVDVVGQLTQLAALRDSGVLTDAEFEAQKAKILAS